MDWQTEPLTSPWLGQQQYSNFMKAEGADGITHSISTASPSPISISSRQSSSRSTDGMSSGTMSVVADSASPRTSSGEASEEDHPTDPPYSQLIYQALINARDRRLPLQQIYAWFEKNTNKGKDQSQKGWQNSIRHNLSMNAVRAPLSYKVPV